jgi:hypothetical protein
MMAKGGSLWIFPQVAWDKLSFEERAMFQWNKDNPIKNQYCNPRKKRAEANIYSFSEAPKSKSMREIDDELNRVLGPKDDKTTI